MKISSFPANLGFYIDRVANILKEEPAFQKLAEDDGDQMDKQENLYYAFHLRNHYKTGYTWTDRYFRTARSMVFNGYGSQEIDLTFPNL